MGRPIWWAFRKKPWGGSNFDFEISNADLASFPTDKVTEHGSGNWEVWHDAVMGLNYLRNIWSYKGILKMNAGTLAQGTRAICQFYFSGAVSSGGIGWVRGNYHAPCLCRTTWKLRIFGRNDLRYYNYVDESTSSAVLMPSMAVNTLYEMESRKDGNVMKCRVRLVWWEWSAEHTRSTAMGTGVMSTIAIMAGNGWGSIWDFRYTNIWVNINE